MPLFDYQCRDCETIFEALTRAGETPECTACGSTRHERLLGRIRPMNAAAAAPEPMGCGTPQCCMRQGKACAAD